MTIGPLEYVMIGVRSDQFMDEIAPVLAALGEQGAIRVVDLLFLEKDDDGAVAIREMGDLATEAQSGDDALNGDLSGLLTAEDISRLAERVPAGASAAVVLLEHAWTEALRESIQRAHGTLLGGGMATPDALAQLEAELAAGEETIP